MADLFEGGDDSLMGIFGDATDTLMKIPQEDGPKKEEAPKEPVEKEAPVSPKKAVKKETKEPKKAAAQKTAPVASKSKTVRGGTPKSAAKKTRKPKATKGLVTIRLEKEALDALVDAAKKAQDATENEEIARKYNELKEQFAQLKGILDAFKK